MNENVNDTATILSVIFKDKNEYEKAKLYFNEKSPFYVDDTNDEFLSIEFEVKGQQDADVTEFYINSELQETDITGYHFEIN